MYPASLGASRLLRPNSPAAFRAAIRCGAEVVSAADADAVTSLVSMVTDALAEPDQGGKRERRRKQPVREHNPRDGLEHRLIREDHHGKLFPPLNRHSHSVEPALVADVGPGGAR